MRYRFKEHPKIPRRLVLGIQRAQKGRGGAEHNNVVFLRLVAAFLLPPYDLGIFTADSVMNLEQAQKVGRQTGKKVNVQMF